MGSEKGGAGFSRLRGPHATLALWLQAQHTFYSQRGPGVDKLRSPYSIPSGQAVGHEGEAECAGGHKNFNPETK